MRRRANRNDWTEEDVCDEAGHDSVYLLQVDKVRQPAPWGGGSANRRCSRLTSTTFCSRTLSSAVTRSLSGTMSSWWVDSILWPDPWVVRWVLGELTLDPLSALIAHPALTFHFLIFSTSGIVFSWVIYVYMLTEEFQIVIRLSVFAWKNISC